VDNDGDTLKDILDGGCAPVGVMSHPGYPTCPTNGCPGIDTDGDGVTDEAEMSIGTDALGRCGVGGNEWDPPSTDWPLDFTHGGTPFSTDLIVITDITSFSAPVNRMDTNPGDANFDRRWDIHPGTGGLGYWINISDLTALYSGHTGYPPMPNGTKAFGSSTPCSAHPVYQD
jgi:hypothetical protein